MQRTAFALAMVLLALMGVGRCAITEAPVTITMPGTAEWLDTGVTVEPQDSFRVSASVPS